MIQNYKASWFTYLYAIDVKSNEWPWSEEKWESIKEYIIRVYSLEEVPRGFSAFRIVANDEIFVYKLSVHPNWRRLGIGTRLHEDIIKFAMDHNKKELITMVHERDEGSIKWLRHWGWLAKTVERNQYSDGDGFIFRREVI